MEYLGRVIEVLANGQFQVQLPDGKVVRCYLSGKMRLNRIKIILGDNVKVELPQGSEIGRVIYRNK